MALRPSTALLRLLASVFLDVARYIFGKNERQSDRRLYEIWVKCSGCLG